MILLYYKGGCHMTVKILTDSCCDLPENIIKEYSIDVLPIAVIKDEKEYLDKVDIQPEDVYGGMKAGEVYKTAQISPNQFKEQFTKYAEEKQSVLYVAFSSGLSGTYQTSIFIRDQLKEEYPDLDIEIVDTKAATIGFGLIVYRAAQLAKEGKSREEIIELCNYYANNLVSIFTVDDLEYLYRGGRVTKTAAVIGSLLNVKPILHVDPEGKLAPLEKVRGRAKVLKRMVEMMEEEHDVNSPESKYVTISHGDDLETANKLKAMIEEKFGEKTFIINMIGAAVGSHSGPGTIAFFFIGDKQK